MSNLLLYGATSRVKSARENGVRIGLGSDWAVSGSKNLLGELKVARLASDEMRHRLLGPRSRRDGHARGRVDPRLAERARLDSIRRARRPHRPRRHDRAIPYKALVHAAETAISLVMINGVPRFGTSALMTRLGADGERVSIGGRQRMLFMKQESADEVVSGISLGQMRNERSSTPCGGCRRSRATSRATGRGPARAMADRLARSGPPVWFLALDELEPTGSELRPRLPGAKGRDSGPRVGTARAVPLSQLVGPMTLDPLTVADDGEFLDQVEAQTILPEFVRRNLKEMY